MQDIIIVGYPKSGNTWITRLVAELVDCPVHGFYKGDHDEIAREGLQRQSSYQCFKSHHQYRELKKLGADMRKVIYVLRDPRDICLSGSKYFQFEHFPKLSRYTKRVPKLQNHLEKAAKKLSRTSYSHSCINQMVNAVLHGSKEVHWYVRMPWKAHYEAYMENRCFYVKYEDMLDHPERECQKILMHLGLQRSQQQISEAIAKQSFQTKKAAFINMGDMRKADFMKVGKKAQWRNAMPRKHLRIIHAKLAEDLQRLGYPKA